MTSAAPTTPSPVNLADALGRFKETWSPRVVATYNNNDVMLARLEGPFTWHVHPDTDDLFLVITGELDIELQDRVVTLKAGELFVVPAGVEHRPVAKGDTCALIMEPTGTPNTGDPATAAKRLVL